MEHHGDSFTRLYSIWQNMKLRCLNVKDKLYKHYGRRVIKVCQEWLVSYTNFRCWSKFYNVPRGKLYRYYKVGKPFVINGKVKQWQKSD